MKILNYEWYDYKWSLTCMCLPFFSVLEPLLLKLPPEHHHDECDHESCCSKSITFTGVMLLIKIMMIHMKVVVIITIIIIMIIMARRHIPIMTWQMGICQFTVMHMGEFPRSVMMMMVWQGIKVGLLRFVKDHDQNHHDDHDHHNMTMVITGCRLTFSKL